MGACSRSTTSTSTVWDCSLQTMSEQDKGVEARHGEKMIAVFVYFWTNNIAGVRNRWHIMFVYVYGYTQTYEAHGLGQTLWSEPDLHLADV